MNNMLEAKIWLRFFENKMAFVKNNSYKIWAYILPQLRNNDLNSVEWVEWPAAVIVKVALRMLYESVWSCNNFIQRLCLSLNWNVVFYWRRTYDRTGEELYNSLGHRLAYDQGVHLETGGNFTNHDGDADDNDKKILATTHKCVQRLCFRSDPLFN